MHNFDMRLVIAILKLFTGMNRLEIWIIIIQKTQNFVEFRPLKAELLFRQSSSSKAYLDWSVKKVWVCGLWGKDGWHRTGEPWIEKLKSSGIAFGFVWIFFFNVKDYICHVLCIWRQM